MLIFPLILSCSFYLNDAFQYPPIRRNESVVENYHGTIVSDPYRWLEDPDSVETRKFVEDQNKLFHDYVSSNQYREKIENDFANYINYPKYGIPSKRGSRYYFTVNTGLQDQGIYYWVQSLDANEIPKLFLDPNKLHPNGTTSLKSMSFSNDGKYCAYGISEGGSDWVTIKIKNTETLDDLPENITKVKFSAASWTSDNLGFFYAQFDQYNGTAGGNATEIPQHQKLFYHYLNTNQSKDIKVLDFPQYPYRIIGIPAVCDTGKYIHLFPFGEGTDTWLVAQLDLPIKGAINFTTLANNGHYTYVASEGDLVYVMTNFNAKKNKLIRVNLTDPDYRNWVDILPEHKTNILTNVVAVNNNSVAAVYVKNVSHVIEIHSLKDGSYIRNLETQMGINVHYIKADRNGSELIYKRSSFMLPEIIYKVDMNTFKKTVFKQSVVKEFNMSNFEIKQAFVPSKDNTVHIPMYIVHKKGLKLDGSAPTLLYAYGGFGSSMMPSYNALQIFFINKLNGIYVLVNARGGGEYGDDWRMAAIRTTKQNTFDDIISAAEYLIKNNYTRRERLAIKGESNGGLTMAASANKRPDLFGAVIAGVGVMDMLRFWNFTVGYTWMAEFGDPIRNEAEFRYIYRYSPLHAMPNKTSIYPATLALTADHDDRVVPAHSYKYIAQLQHQLGAQVPQTPLMIRVDTDSGHGAGKPTSKWIKEYADIISFLMNSLKLDYNSSK